MNLRRLRLWVATAVFLLALILLLVSSIPVSRFHQVLPMPPINLPIAAPTTGSVLLEQRVLGMNWPETLRQNDSDWIELSIDPKASTQTVADPKIEAPDIFATYTILTVARLDLAGLETPLTEIRESLLPGRQATFRWAVRAGEPGVYRGTIWLHLQFVPKANGPVDERLVLARPLEIRVADVMGFPGSIARFLGGTGIVISLLLGYPLLRDWRERAGRQ